MWEVATTDEFDGWFAALSDPAKRAVVAKVRLLEDLGPRLKRPHADTLEGSQFANMKELRADALGDVIRVAFAFDPERKAILLIGGSKQGVSQRLFYSRLIRHADRLYAEHLRRLETGE